ncbi:DMT family transporter [Solicola gregarius]|uniref:DMT family transporter n=1 Tax=Solicola gregarius TaxID=2908642 RepID=A0AA46TIF2_9ACTN|nr:DMT family transporter [Solicola gregarius]UYM05845.1 DMT family transporter [Solicola gregarius]
MGIALALFSAMSYGTSDVLGGLAARRLSPVRVALIGQVGALCVTGLIMLISTDELPSAADLAWGACSGVGTGLGMAFLFRGISRGAMSVVVPVSAVGGVALPVVVGAVVLGETPPWLTWVGVLIALPALWLISSKPREPVSAARGPVLDGLAASGGIALQYLCLAQAGTHAGLWPILSGRIGAIATVVLAAATFMREPPTTRDRAAASWTALALSVAAGALAATALGAYLFALRTELITVAVVISSLYPVVPVAVGRVILGERLELPQGLGIAAALVSTVLIVIS